MMTGVVGDIAATRPPWFRRGRPAARSPPELSLARIDRPVERATRMMGCTGRSGGMADAAVSKTAEPQARVGSNPTFGTSFQIQNQVSGPR